MLSTDASRLAVSTAEAEKLVVVTWTTLARNVPSGNQRPAIALQKTGRERLHSYWLSDILWVLGWRRVNPIIPGRGSRWLPERVPARASLSDGIAARVAPRAGHRRRALLADRSGTAASCVGGGRRLAEGHRAPNSFGASRLPPSTTR